MASCNLKPNLKIILPLLAAVGLVSGVFQNCSQQGLQTSNSGSAEGGEVRIVDDWAQKSLSFVEANVLLKADAELVSFDGICPRKSAAYYQWELSSGSGEILRQGLVQCDWGGFRIAPVDLAGLECGRPFTLKVFDDSRLSSSLSLTLECAEVESQKLISSDPTSGESCFINTILGECTQSCYAQDRLLRRQVVARNLCADI